MPGCAFGMAVASWRRGATIAKNGFGTDHLHSVAHQKALIWHTASESGVRLNAIGTETYTLPHSRGIYSPRCTVGLVFGAEA